MSIVAKVSAYPIAVGSTAYNTSAIASNINSRASNCTINAKDLPIKIPSGSVPATRSASSAPSAVSTAKDLCTMTNIEKSVASHTNPGATRCKIPSLSSAKANIIIITKENGATWFSNTLLDHSMRRSLRTTARETRRTVCMRDVMTRYQKSVHRLP